MEDLIGDVQTILSEHVSTLERNKAFQAIYKRRDMLMVEEVRLSVIIANYKNARGFDQYLQFATRTLAKIYNARMAYFGMLHFLVNKRSKPIRAFLHQIKNLEYEIATDSKMETNQFNSLL